MIGFLKKLMRSGNHSPDLKQLVQDGAMVLDVRSPGEFNSGHIQGAINISVDQLAANMNRLKDKNQPIITCCASGMRSTTAKNILKAGGYTRVYNGGGWHNLKQKIS